MALGYSLEQHDETGTNLHVFHNLVQDIATTYCDAWSLPDEFCNFAKIFTSSAENPIYILQRQMNDYACRELPHQTASKLYMRNSNSYLEPEFLVGIPTAMTEAYKQARLTKSSSEKESGLSDFEIFYMLACLNHISHRIAVIGMETAEAYHDMRATDKARAATDALQILINALWDVVDSKLLDCCVEDMQ